MNQALDNMACSAGNVLLGVGSLTEGDAAIYLGSSAVERLEVHSGSQLGASLSVDSHNGFTVGTGYDNDVVLRCTQVETVRLRVDFKRGIRRIQLVEGLASVGNVDLESDQFMPLPDGSAVIFGDVSFVVTASVQKAEAAAEELQVPASASVTRTRSFIALVAGIALLGVVFLQDTLIADASGLVQESTLKQQLDELRLEHLEVVASTETDLPIVQGRVADHSEFSQLRLLRNAAQKPFTLDVQVDAELVGAVQDVYRNHGVTADISVLGVGYVRVATQSADQAALAGVENALQADIPKLLKIDAINTPPEIPEDVEKMADLDPGKEVEAVIAGGLSYVITRDQSRYFIGAILPSGHTIKSISEGTVVMLKNGEETQFQF